MSNVSQLVGSSGIVSIEDADDYLSVVEKGEFTRLSVLRNVLINHRFVLLLHVREQTNIDSDFQGLIDLHLSTEANCMSKRRYKDDSKISGNSDYSQWTLQTKGSENQWVMV